MTVPSPTLNSMEQAQYIAQRMTTLRDIYYPKKVSGGWIIEHEQGEYVNSGEVYGHKQDWEKLL